MLTSFDVKRKDFLKQKQYKTKQKTLPPNKFSLWPASHSRTDKKKKNQVCKERAVELHTPELNKNMED